MIHTEHKDFQLIRNEKLSNLERMLYIFATNNLYTGNVIANSNLLTRFYPKRLSANTVNKLARHIRRFN